MKSSEVLPGKGWGRLQFGMTMTDVDRLLGPSAATFFEEDGDYSLWRWEYPADGVCLFFGREDNFRLSSIEVDSSSEAKLLGEPLFPGTRETVIDLLRRNLTAEQKDRDYSYDGCRDVISERFHYLFPTLCRLSLQCGEG